eukprot:CAMPEP_0116064314 /NCGR_PEP_ID=MMETSP0322-20121206/9018_1 /TAXON_ID=163516 /ORGANISM="Leptocylindrus danicus var. apora, Strain B651" /LENGTH=1002 /DNA_ID=CAMNT_0003550263 /DNA_START=193 /DNA_END=3202 /DNA_ORIENTATION=+
MPSNSSNNVTLSPTTIDLVHPSTNPSLTHAPSLYPTPSPSNVPSVTQMPSLFPTRVPSIAPSVTHTPSLKPSSVPSIEPSANPTLSHVPSPNPSHCYDLPDWTDSQGDGCDWYGAQDDRCERYGTQYKKDGYTASLACCVCNNGGFYLSDRLAPSHSPTIERPTVCYDNMQFRDSNGFTCLDYERNVDDDDAFLQGLTKCDLYDEGANENCCFCGGGFREPYVPSAAPNGNLLNTMPPTGGLGDQNDTLGCLDVFEWTDALGESCESFYNDDNGTRCDRYGEGYMKHGYVANNACCNCRGGLNASRAIYIPPTPKPRPVNPLTEDPNGELCIDTPNWRDKSGKYSCDRYDFKSNDVDTFTCDQYGHIRGENSKTASESCCICGGGYNGSLIGRTFRVTFPDDAEAMYTLYTNHSAKNGSVYQLVHDLSNNTGFHMYEVDLSSESNSLNNSYSACLYDLIFGFTDICIGPFWNTADYDFDTISKVLFTDDFYLVVPSVEQDFLSILYTPFQSFRFSAWLAVFLVTGYVAFAMNIIRNNGLCLTKRACYFRCGDACFHAWKSLAGGDLSNAKDDDEASGGEKIIVQLFPLVILTAYTATSAAFLVNFVEEKYVSLEDVISKNATICLHKRIESSFTKHHAQASDLVKSTFYTTDQLLDEIDESCDVALVSIDSFKKVCAERKLNGVKMLKDEIIMSLDNILPVRELLDDWATAFLAELDKMILSGEYNDLHRYYLDREDLSNDCFDSAESELVQLGYVHLAAPLVLTSILTTVGLFVFLSDRKKSLALRKALSSTVGIQMHDKLNDEMHQLRIDGMSPASIVRELASCNVSSEELKHAMNLLPDATMLKDLLYNHQCSSYRRDYNVLSTLTISELCEVYDRHIHRDNEVKSKNYSCDLDDVPQESSRESSNLFITSKFIESSLVEVLNDGIDPKSHLIEFILDDKDLRRAALLASFQNSANVLNGRTRNLTQIFDNDQDLEEDNDDLTSHMIVRSLFLARSASS